MADSQTAGKKPKSKPAQERNDAPPPPRPPGVNYAVEQARQFKDRPTEDRMKVLRDYPPQRWIMPPPNYHRGGKVRATGPARLLKGERVLGRREARSYRGRGKGR